MHSILLTLALAPAVQDDPSLLHGPLARPADAAFTATDAPGQPLAATTLSAVEAPGAPSWSQPEAPLSLGLQSTGEVKAGDCAAPTLRSRLSIRELMTEVLFQSDEAGAVWARGRDYRASFGPEGFTFLPVFGKAAPRNLPVAFELRRVTVGGETLGLGIGEVARDGATVTLGHGTLREVYHLDLDGVEQTFVFDELGGNGDLVLDIAVASELATIVDADGLHFVHPTLGHVTYGEAFVLDAAGARQAIERVWTGDGIQLRVPAEFVANAVLPLTVDPRVSAVTNTYGNNDDSRPDVCFDGRQSRYWVVWEEYVSASDVDCYITSFAPGGPQRASFAVELTTDSWTEPKVAYHYGANRLLVVASEDASGSGRIEGQLVDAAANSLIGTAFQISTCCFAKINPDVGGNNYDSITNSHFCVVWSFQAAPGNHDVQYRIVDWDGTFVTGVTTVDNSTDDTLQTTISESHGDATLAGDWWTIAWTRDSNADGLGAIEARRVVWNGNTAVGAGNFVVDSSTNCAWPSVTSRLDANLGSVADRPSIVAYERQFTTGGGTPPNQRSIYARVVTDGTVFSSNVITTLEDGITDIDQRDCSIATDGSAWYLSYSEIFHGNPAGADYDVYYCAGHLSETSTDVFLALAERHQVLAFSGSAERWSRVATVWDGSSGSTSDDAIALWIDLDGTNGGTVEGYTLDIPTTDTSLQVAVGRQFCPANPNGGPAVSGLQGSWMWLEGTQGINDQHIAFCEDVTPNATGYLITSRTSGSVQNPAGSAGRLCVLGAGRYINNVQNSGGARTFGTLVSPWSLPQPNGFVSAAPGETWYFQYWHRDVQNGLPTSNFSNACAVTFAP